MTETPPTHPQAHGGKAVPSAAMAELVRAMEAEGRLGMLQGA